MTKSNLDLFGLVNSEHDFKLTVRKTGCVKLWGQEVHKRRIQKEGPSFCTLCPPRNSNSQFFHGFLLFHTGWSKQKMDNS